MLTSQTTTNADQEASTDEALMLAFAKGDAAAFAALYDRHERGVWRFVFRSVKNQEVADDVSQELWFAVARSAASYVPTAK